MLPDPKGPRTAIAVMSLVLLGFALFADLPALHKGFLLADQSVYYAMAQSLAFDGDLEYTKRDLVRYKEEFAAGPQGIFLKRIRTPGGERLVYAKSMAYALFAAPFVRVFRSNGPLVFQAILFALILIMGFAYFSRSDAPGLSLLKTATFLLASVAWVYALWIAPDFFNLFCSFTALFLWRYKHRGADGTAPDGESSPRPGPLQRFLVSDGSDVLAAAFAAVAAYSKPPNVVVFAPILLGTVLRRRPGKAAVLALVFAAVFGVLFGTNVLLTGDWNYQGGERKSFYFDFPYERPDLTFDTARGRGMTADGYLDRALFPAKFVAFNLFYFFFGRFTGLAWYFFPALLALILFFRRKRERDGWLLLAALTGGILIYVVLMPDNFGGGGGSLANRYFLGIYPLFFFLPGPRLRRGEIVVSWAMAALFISPILLGPLQASASPAGHAKRFPHTLLPVEYTLINDLPTNTNPSSFRQMWGRPLVDGRFLYFLNDNYNAKHEDEDGWWTLGDRKLDAVLRTFTPVREVVVRLLNNPRRENMVTVSVDGRTQTISLGPRQRGELRFPVGDGFQVRVSHMYRVKIRSAKSSIPYFEDARSDEKRLLGVFFEIETVGK